MPTTEAEPASPGRPDWQQAGPMSAIDHTLLKSTATPVQIAQLCEEAVELGFAAVCIPPFFVAQARELLYGSDVQLATVIGFPLGYESTSVKQYQAEQAIAAGATEIDMVIQLGSATVDDFTAVEFDICAVVGASAGAAVKVIIECCYFDAEAKKRLTEAVVSAGAAYVKTSTGFAQSGATVEDVRLLHRIAAGRIKVKAAGGIRDWQSCRAMLEAGATRIGTSAGVEIARQWLQDRA
jgi:deoxyribose-phosphate aldolase